MREFLAVVYIGILLAVFVTVFELVWQAWRKAKKQKKEKDNA